MINLDLIGWHCPNCDEVNFDHPDQYTHCAYCGEVVYVLNEDDYVDDQNWKVDINEYLRGK